MAKKGVKFSEEHKKKLSLSKLGSLNPRFGISPWNKNKHLSEETKQKIREKRAKQVFSIETKLKMSNSMKGKNSGKNHYLWIEDRTKLIGKHTRSFHDSDYKIWRKEVCNRDNWKCKINNKDCKGRLEVHHILGWKDHPELRYKINNGITLCHYHHPFSRKDEIELSPYFEKLIIGSQ